MFDIYKQVRTDNGINTLPFVKLDLNATDKYETFFVNRTRLFKLADKYYSDATMWKIILMANPQFTSEFMIPDGYNIRIPFPSEKVKEEYRIKVAQLIEV